VIAYAFHPEAEAEFIESSAFLESRLPGLGEAFAAAVAAAISLIGDYPEIGVPDGPARRCLRVQRFPYSVVYEYREDSILILAVAHGRRQPGYWRARA